MRKTNFYKILFLICFWIICTLFIVFYEAAVLGFKSEIEGGEYSFVRIMIIAVLNCLVGASILASIDVLYLGKLLRKKPFGISILIRTFLYLLFILFFTSISRIYIVSSEINQPMFSKEVLGEFINYLFSARVLSTILFWGIACMAALFILQVSEKFGQGVLINFLLGKYHKPKEEERIFMFMDLKSSTTHAEKLGHIKYSRLIQDCYYDLTDVVLKHHAFIYQYVGDEVVLSWDIKKGIEESNCLYTFFDYDNEIKKRAEYYKNNYGIIPEFKAGLDMGYATVVEVGQIKKELAYHGDVLNTASRIQGKCNDFQSKLLISEKLWEQLNNQDKSNFKLIGNIPLKGKQQPVNIFRYNL